MDENADTNRDGIPESKADVPRPTPGGLPAPDLQISSASLSMKIVPKTVTGTKRKNKEGEDEITLHSVKKEELSGENLSKRQKTATVTMSEPAPSSEVTGGLNCCR